jgi:hypothetical protein
MNGYLCPVCSYRGLEYPPQDFTICPCCGTEFGLDDFAESPQGIEAARRELRRAWLDAGGPWFDPETPRPIGWNPYEQIWASAGTPAVTISGATVSECRSTIGSVLDSPARLVYA